ncbi:Hypothetical protein HEAR3226 [Herminiimonas arsenicoxydans]|uniref:Uncharacterized protein n=1 Tax=Herminiimonas arsenicoxydans TaxID=204773 RepID=A4G9Z6_HERAR|nr:Hypothetical protein HEAR3226 [Herminiimonas arsenicoxydans]
MTASQFFLPDSLCSSKAISAAAMTSSVRRYQLDLPLCLNREEHPKSGVVPDDNIRHESVNERSFNV